MSENFVRPLRGKILVKLLDVAGKSKGGILIPSTARQENCRAEVIAIGNPKVLNDGRELPTELALGNVVVFHKQFADEIEVEGTKYAIIDEPSILCILPNN